MWEYLVAYVVLRYSLKRPVSYQVKLHGNWAIRRSACTGLLFSAVAVGEEVIYRQVWFTIFSAHWGLEASVTLLLSSLAYGANHSSFGSRSVVGKLGSGMIYGWLYVLSDHCIFVPITTHVLQNLCLIVIFGERK
jgi:membrane protease YdiL (CAAX protease family)